MKKIEWIHENKMLFESEHKSFNKFITCISTGNVYGDGQTSLYIRPYNEIECNEHIWEKGHLRQYDLTNWNSLPYYITNYIEKVTKNKSIILYKFWYIKNSKQIVLGYVITRPVKNGYKLLHYWNLTGTQKTEGALRECLKYLVSEEK